jgi:predicted anti-sigma-YlaC factor YlaD
LGDEHLHPNRGWTLIRDSGRFTPAEIAHLKDCSQCSEWIALFAELARKAGFIFDFGSPGPFAPKEHLSPERGWSLIRDRRDLTSAETGHLRYCPSCNEWLSSFAAIARRSGFAISFEIPQLRNTA